MIDSHQLALFAVNSGELYPTHKAITGAPLSTWLSHVQNTVVPLYARQVEPVAVPLSVAVNTADALRDYYREHAAEWAQTVMEALQK
jgi:hypothetical protein